MRVDDLRQYLYTHQTVLTSASKTWLESDKNECGKVRKQKEKYFERKNSVGEPRGTNLSKRGVAR